MKLELDKEPPFSLFSEAICSNSMVIIRSSFELYESLKPLTIFSSFFSCMNFKVYH